MNNEAPIYFATKQKISKIEREVRKNLGLPELDMGSAAEDIEELLKKPELRGMEDELKDLKEYYESE